MSFSFKSTIYIRLTPTQISLREVERNISLRCEPLIAIDTRGKRRVLAFGDEAAQYRNKSDVIVVNPFAHPRTMISDFTVANVLFKDLTRKLVAEKSWFRPAPVITLHLDIDPEGGFTQVELRAFRELCVGAGARKHRIWEGRPLTDAEICSDALPTGGEVLS